MLQDYQNERSFRRQKMKQSPFTRLRPNKAILPPGGLAEGTRRRILEVGLRLFAARGFHGTSVRDLAAALELQPSALYAHFPSKEHLLAELVLLGYQAQQEIVRTRMREAGDHPVAQIRALVRSNAWMHATYPQLAVIANEEAHSLPAELLEPVLAVRGESVSMLIELIMRGIAAKLFFPPDPFTTAAALGAMAMRIPYWFEATNEQAIESLMDNQAELALRMLGVVGR